MLNPADFAGPFDDAVLPSPTIDDSAIWSDEPNPSELPPPDPSRVVTDVGSSANFTRTLTDIDSLPSPEPPPTPMSAPPQMTAAPPRRSHESSANGRRRGGVRWLLYFAAGLFVLLVLSAIAIAIAGASFLNKILPSVFPSSRPDLITHKVKPEYLQVTVVERGTLESADNKEVICKVKAGSPGTFASTIKWVIDDGSTVVRGQLLMELDDSSLQDQFRTQSIAVEKANSEWVKADEAYRIQIKTSESAVATAVALLKVAELDLDKFLGIRADPAFDPFAALAGGPATLVERGEYRSKLDAVSGDLKLAESNLEAYRDRAAWAEREVRKGNLTPTQAKVEQSKLDSELDKVAKLQKDRYVLTTFMRQRDLTDLTSKADVARIGVEKANQEAYASQIQADFARKTAYSVYMQETEKLRDIEEQLKECKIYAPQEGMVVYYKEERGRFGQSTEGMIAQGAQVKEGQKMMRIPDLKRMQVNTKVHEAMVSRIRGDDRQSTGFLDTLRVGLLTNPNALSRLLLNSEATLTTLREQYRREEYIIASRGQTAKIRVDAFPNRVIEGHVRSKAAVASQTDFFASEVKVYQTLVILDESVEGLQPDMSAEVTIQVDPPREPVLCVPLQAVVGGAEGGSKRRVFVMTPSGPEEKEVTLGLFNEKMVEVREGLSEGDDVVLNPKVILGDKAKTREEGGDLNGRRGNGNGQGFGPGAGAGGEKGGGKAAFPGAGTGMPGGGAGGKGTGGGAGKGGAGKGAGGGKGAAPTGQP